MRLTLITFFSLLCAVNLSIISVITSKRLGFLGLVVILISDLITKKKLHFKNTAIEVIYFWLMFVLSSILGLLISNEINSTVLAIGLTSFNIVLLKLILDSTNNINLNGFYLGWYLASFSLSLLFLYKVLLIVEFDFFKVVFLRKYLLEGAFSINSTFNQIVILIFCNLFILFNSKFSTLKRYLSLFLTTCLFFFIVFSLSRQNLIACLLMFNYLFYKFTNFKFKIYCFVVLVPILTLFVSTKINVEDLSGITTRIDKTVSQVTNTDYTRFQQFSDSFVAGTESPVLGIGLGSYYNYAKSLGYSEHVRVPEAAVNQVVAEHGIIMLIIFLSTISNVLLN